jgi:hypothetical protein
MSLRQHTFGEAEVVAVAMIVILAVLVAVAYTHK